MARERVHAALEIRERRARDAVDAAREGASAAQRAALGAELAELDAKITAKDRELTGRALAFKRELAADVGELRALVSRANALHTAQGGFDPLTQRRRGCYWLQEGPLELLVARAEPPAPRS
jgi:hypothetical protein